MTNQFDVRGQGANVIVGQPVPSVLGKHEALQLAAHLVASSTDNPEKDFAPVYQMVISSKRNN